MIYIAQDVVLAGIIVVGFAAFGVGIALGAIVGRRQRQAEVAYYRRVAVKWWRAYRENVDEADWWKST